MSELPRGLERDAVDAVARVAAVPMILRLIPELTGLRLALVAEVTQDRWRCCAVNDTLGVGLAPRGELDLDSTLCKDVRDARRPIMFGDAAADPRYATHPAARRYDVQSFIAVPIFLRDQYFGNLCALDTKPAALTATTLALFEIFAELIGFQLCAEVERELTQRELSDERATGGLREQFIAMLAHDLRSPLAAIVMGVEVLALRNPGDAGTQAALTRMKQSAGKMTGLVEDLMDFARGRLGGGVPLARAEIEDSDALIHGVADEQRTASNREIVVDGTAGGALHGDRARIAQALSNLVSNAIQHGTPKTPIRIAVRRADGVLSVAVHNHGPAIPSDRLAAIFAPYTRGATNGPRTGLGLGLYIVSEIARAHGGDVTCTSTHDEGTTFTIRIPA